MHARNMRSSLRCLGLRITGKRGFGSQTAFLGEANCLIREWGWRGQRIIAVTGIHAQEGLHHQHTARVSRVHVSPLLYVKIGPSDHLAVPLLSSHLARLAACATLSVMTGAGRQAASSGSDEICSGSDNSICQVLITNPMGTQKLP